MTVPASPSHRERRIAKALTSVKAAENARRLFDNLPEGHGAKTQENDETTRAFLAATIRTAMSYGYPVEAVAVAAGISTDEVLEIVRDAAA